MVIGLNLSFENPVISNLTIKGRQAYDDILYGDKYIVEQYLNCI